MCQHSLKIKDEMLLMDTILIIKHMLSQHRKYLKKYHQTGYSFIKFINILFYDVSVTNLTMNNDMALK